MNCKKFSNWAGTAVIAGTLLIAACADKDYPRGQFQGYVIGHTEEEIVDKVGKPAEINRSDPKKPVLIFKAKTFDVDNYNKADPVTRVFLEEKDGKIVAVDVVFG